MVVRKGSEKVIGSELFARRIFTSSPMYSSECGHWHKTALIFPRRSYFATEFKESLFFISAPSIQQQSLSFLCFVLNRFLLSDLTTSSSSDL